MSDYIFSGHQKEKENFLLKEFLFFHFSCSPPFHGIFLMHLESFHLLLAGIYGECIPRTLNS